MTAAEHPEAWTREHLRRLRLRSALAMTPAERLAWLERLLGELGPLLGRARRTAGQSGAERRGD